MRAVGDGVYRLDAAAPISNAYLVEAEAWVLVDAGTRARGPRIVAELERAGIAPEWVLLTHGDLDHVGGADAVREATGAIVCAAAAERPMLEGALWHRLGRARRTLLRARYPLGLPRAPTVDRWLEPGDEVAGIAVLATPGHTPGHTSYVARRTLVAGDAVVTGRRFRESPRLFTIDREAARRSIEALAELDVDLAVSGHGRPARDARAKLAALADTWRR